VGEPALDPEAFLERLKADHRILRWEPLPPDQVPPVRESDQIRSKSSLEYLHHHWALPDTFDPAVAGGGFRGKIVGIVGRLTYRVLSPYLRAERDLLAHVVRINEALEQRCDELTLRYEQLSREMINRQAAEAANQAKLAAWLHLDPPRASSPDSRAPRIAGSGDSAIR
jgi:hypothetical protein